MTLSSPEPRPANAAASAAADPRQDPAMRTLFRMSRTAGVGLQDYAAVNVLSVVGVLVALSSVLVLIFADVPALLALPVGAIIISVLAFIQIVRSNGTQTGRAIAIAGVVIALLIGGANVFGHVRMAEKQAASEKAIHALVQRFSEAALADKPADAYALFDTRFQQSVQLETFGRTLKLHVERTFDGPRMAPITVGDRFVFEVDANGVDFASALLILTPDGKVPEGIPLSREEPAEFRDVDGEWKFRGIPTWFQSAQTSAPAKPGT